MLAPASPLLRPGGDVEKREVWRPCQEEQHWQSLCRENGPLGKHRKFGLVGFIKTNLSYR